MHKVAAVGAQKTATGPQIASTAKVARNTSTGFKKPLAQSFKKRRLAAMVKRAVLHAKTMNRVRSGPSLVKSTHQQTQHFTPGGV